MDQEEALFHAQAPGLLSGLLHLKAIMPEIKWGSNMSNDTLKDCIFHE